MEFPPFKNSLLYEMCSKRKSTWNDDPSRKRSRLPPDSTKNLSLVSGLYLYTNTPPHGYGTQAPKVAETIRRAYSFNMKTENKTLNIFGRDVERMHWEVSDGDFPFDQIHGNFIPSECRIMVERFLKSNQPYIDSCADSIMKKVLETNSDVLTKGRQTYCPFSGQSVTSAVAYKRMYEFLSANSGNQCLSCLEWIQAFFILFEKESITFKTSAWIDEDIRKYDRLTKQRVTVRRKVKKMVEIKTKNKAETQNELLKISTRFASYIKHKERGRKERRAIASANMILRMFLYIIEEFHLELSKKVEGATISIGGEEKKQKISSNMSSATLPSGPATTICQGTEDATKWNECLAPSLFALMHKYLFDKHLRIKCALPPPTEMGGVFQLIAIAGNFLMSMKEIQIGKGLTIYNDSEYDRMCWSEEWRHSMNDETREWFDSVKDKITDDHQYFRASPGMLMGMLNAGSTTLGLLATNHRMSSHRMRVMTLRSSDDSMSLYMGLNAVTNKDCIEMNRRNLGMLGINLSPDKTFFFREGLGEYTSWYMDRRFVSQFGTETSSMRPKGINPHDDFYSVAKETATSLSTLTINHVGAAVRLKLGIDNVRRLWRIKRDMGKRENISDLVLLLSDGGKQLWHACNCHLEEISVRERHANEEERKYLLRIQNPDNPFSHEPQEEMTFSKEHGTLILETIETPRTCFNYLKKSNRTFNATENREKAENEKMNHEAAKLINFIDPTTMISYPSSNCLISSHLSATLKIEAGTLDLDDEQKDLLARAVEILDTGNVSLLDEEQEGGYDIESDHSGGEFEF